MRCRDPKPGVEDAPGWGDNLPVGISLTITETNGADYTTTATDTANAGRLGNIACTLTVHESGDTVTFKNVRDTTSITIRKVDNGKSPYNPHYLRC